MFSTVCNNLHIKRQQIKQSFHKAIFFLLTVIDCKVYMARFGLKIQLEVELYVTKKPK